MRVWAGQYHNVCLAHTVGVVGTIRLYCAMGLNWQGRQIGCFDSFRYLVELKTILETVASFMCVWCQCVDRQLAWPEVRGRVDDSAINGKISIQWSYFNDPVSKIGSHPTINLVLLSFHLSRPGLLCCIKTQGVSLNNASMIVVYMDQLLFCVGRPLSRQGRPTSIRKNRLSIVRARGGGLLDRPYAPRRNLLLRLRE